MAKSRGAIPTMKHEERPPMLNMEGKHAKKMMDCKPGQKVKMTVEGRLSETTNKAKKPEWGPQHSASVEITKISRAPGGKSKFASPKAAKAPKGKKPGGRMEWS